MLSKTFLLLLSSTPDTNYSSMKKLTTLLLLVGLAGNLFAQESAEKVMEKRAREMYRAITLPEKDQWKKFIRENYSQALIDKPMRAAVNTEENGTVVTSSTEEPAGTDNVDKKAGMSGQLHDNFGDSKISSLKVVAETATMILQSSSDATGTITLRFSKTKPYLIEGLGIEVEN